MNVVYRRVLAGAVLVAAAGGLFAGTAAASPAVATSHTAVSDQASLSVSGTVTFATSEVIKVRISDGSTVTVLLTSATTIKGKLSVGASVTVSCHRVNASLVADAVVVG